MAQTSLVAPLPKNLPAMRETWVQSLGCKDPLEKERLPTPVFWPREFHGLYSPWGRSWTWLSDFHFHFPQWLSGKESTCNAWDTGDAASIPGSGRSPGEGNGNPLQYSCLENYMDRGAWQATIYGITNRHWVIEQNIPFFFFNGLKQHEFIILQLCRSETWHQSH